MATKKVATKLSAPRAWEDNDELYPRKRGVCEFCGQRDDLKLAFDQLRYICLNAHACLLRWQKRDK